MKTDRYIDLSHTIFDGLVTYKGLPAPIVCDFLSREESRKHYDTGTEFHIARIDMVANTGTYMDCPFHRFANGKDFSQIKLEAFTDLGGITIQATKTHAIGVDHFLDKPLTNRAVLIHTGWAKHWNTESYFEGHPFLTEEAAIYLRDAGVRLVGIDSYNIDDTTGKTRPAHTALLSADILIVEHLTNLDKLPESGFTFSAIPPKFQGVGSFPIRAFAKLND